MVHFHREKYVSRGGPDGGDGGRGGDVILEVSPILNTLAAFRRQRRFIADSGANGGPNNMSGKSAPNLTILVPPGTIVYDNETGELMGDLVEPGQKLMVAKGGRGGRGNQHYATSSNQVPRMATKGELPEEHTLRLELKLIADIGIVGVPNAGKSSLLAAVTNATPKIADYPFTTLEPNLGVAELDLDTTLVLADIPGLIEGAHMGVGLGDAFLRHIQRTRVIIHLLDGMSADPIADFSQINSELALFDEHLANKLQIVALNKIDLPEVQERWPAIKAALEEHGVEDPVAVSAVTHAGLHDLLWRAERLLQIAPEAEPVIGVPVYRPAEDPTEFTIERTSEGWQVHGVAIERAAERTYWEHYEFDPALPALAGNPRHRQGAAPGRHRAGRHRLHRRIRTGVAGLTRLGIFGGTFDPPHIGHLILASEAFSQLNLERVLWVLTPNPPHKRGKPVSALEQRLVLVQAALAPDPHFELSRIDIDRPPPHYAADTIELLHVRYSAATLVYLLGGDSLHDLPAWHDPQRFVQHCDEIGVMRRSGDAVNLPCLEQQFPGLAGKVRFVETPLIDISASEIRQRILEGRSFRYFVPSPVYEIIISKGFYQS